MVFTLMYLEYEASLLYFLIDYWQNRYKVSPYFETNQVDGTFSSGLKNKYKEEHPDAKAIVIAEVMSEYGYNHQILLDKNSGINAIDTNTLLNILEWSGKDARVFYFKGRFGDYVIIKSKGVYALMLVNKVWDDVQEPDTRLIGKAKPIVEKVAETKQPTLSEERKKKKASKSTDKKETAQDKIDDVGEKIDGARKDALKKLAESMDKTTEEALVAMPFSKVFKRPNLKKAVEDGATSNVYNSLGGEVEARNVEKRMGMTPEERRASLAADTEDVRTKYSCLERMVMQRVKKRTMLMQFLIRNFQNLQRQMLIILCFRWDTHLPFYNQQELRTNQ